MDPAASLRHCLSAAEAERFERDGYLIVPDALSPAEVQHLTQAVDALADDRADEVEEDGRLHLRDFLKRDPVFLDLLDWPTTFPKVWGIMGWHIQLYLSHIDVTPPVADASGRGEVGRLSWHQDTGRVNVDIETEPRPRLSLKVAYFLTDTQTTGCGNLWVLPGSQRESQLVMPADPNANPPGAIPICVPAGTAVFFDRRVWHSRSPNLAEDARKAIFYGYSYRWLRPRDNLRIEDYEEVRDPIRRQLLGAVGDGHGFSSPQPGDVPLKDWIAEHAGLDAVVP